MQKYTLPFRLQQWLTIWKNIVFTRRFAGDFTADNPSRSHYQQMVQANSPEGALLQDRTTRRSKGDRNHGQLRTQPGP